MFYQWPTKQTFGKRSLSIETIMLKQKWQRDQQKLCSASQTILYFLWLNFVLAIHYSCYYYILFCRVTYMSFVSTLPGLSWNTMTHDQTYFLYKADTAVYLIWSLFISFCQISSLIHMHETLINTTTVNHPLHIIM